MSILDQLDDPYTPTQDEKTMALLSHVLTLVVGFIAPLVIYLMKKDESDFVRQHAAESLNFQISLAIFAIAAAILIIVVIGIFLLIGIGIVAFVFVILGTIKASEGKEFRYPFNIRFVQ